MEKIRMHYSFSGRVQGVGFRYTAYYAAVQLGLTGFVENEEDGTVTMELQGTAEDIKACLRTIQESRWIRIDDMFPRKMKPVEGEREFHVRGY